MAPHNSDKPKACSWVVLALRLSAASFGQWKGWTPSAGTGRLVQWGCNDPREALTPSRDWEMWHNMS